MFLTSHLKDKGKNCFKCTLQPSRYSLDKFDERLLARDERITGSRFRQKVTTDFKKPLPLLLPIQGEGR